MAKPTPKSKLPKRFQPYLDQATTEAELRYGGQEATFATVLGQLARDRDRRLDAQATAQSALLGSLNGADANVDRYYKESGLDPSVLSTLATDPTGKRLAGEMAGYRAQNQQGLLGSLAGDQYQRSRINEDFTDRSGTVYDQATAEQKERGTFVSSLLNQLITGDRAARSAANAQARKQAHADLQAELDRAAAQGNALIGQGLTTDESGKLLPLPGGKADPNAPGNQPKPKKPSKPTGADRTIQADFRKAASWVKQLDAATAKEQPDAAKRRQTVQEILLKGDQVSGIPSISSAGLDVALDAYYDKVLSDATVQALHNAGVKVKFLQGVQTENQREKQRRKAIKKTSRTNANLGRDSNGQMRPT